MNVEILSATPDPEELACRAARNDYGADATAPFSAVIEPIEGDTIQEKKENLLAKLIDRGHYGVLEHPTATFCIQNVSRVLMAQLTRHRHASFDIMSLRYVEVNDPEVYDIPELDDANPSGRNAEVADQYSDLGDTALTSARRRIYNSQMDMAFESYRDLINLGVAPEHARMVLPLATKVNIVMTVNLRALLHIADMRAAGDAQKEIRDMTEELLDVAREWAPFVIDYYEDTMKGRKNRLSP